MVVIHLAVWVCVRCMEYPCIQGQLCVCVDAGLNLKVWMDVIASAVQRFSGQTGKKKKSFRRRKGLGGFGAF